MINLVRRVAGPVGRARMAGPVGRAWARGPGARDIGPADAMLVAALVLLAGAVRSLALGYVTHDMQDFLLWYHSMQQHNAFHALKYEIGNYNAPYLYLLDIARFLPFSAVSNIKLVYLVFDAVLCYYTYRVVALRLPGWRMPVLAATLVAFLPTVIVNASMYGQCDSMYAAFTVGGMYHVLRRQPWAACALFGLAYALKPQAIFVFPLLLLLALAGHLPWRSLIAAPIVYLALDVPALLAGRGVVELLTVYLRQATASAQLTMNAASVYQFVPSTGADQVIRPMGRLFAVALVVMVCFALLAARVPFTAERIVLSATGFAVMVPFFLPAMHERYFYAADVLSVILACYRPRLWPVPILVQTASFLSYLPVLLRIPRDAVIDFRILSALMLAALIMVGYALAADLIRHHTKKAAFRET